MALPFHRLLLVCLVIPLPLGAAELQFRGLRVMGESEVRNTISGRLEYIEARPATPSRADDAAYMLERILHRRGFNEATVTATIPSPDIILLTVEEGPYSVVGEVTITGIPEEFGKEVSDEILAINQAQRRLFGQLREQATPYIESEEAARIENTRKLMQSKGYWDASVTLASKKRNPGSGAVDLVLDVNPGPRHTLARPVVLRSDQPDSATEGRLAGLEGELATTENINRARNRVERIYRRGGYADAEILMLAEHAGDYTQLTFRIAPGRQYTVGKVTVENPGVTEPERISKRFDEFVGQPYDGDEVNRKVARLLGTGAFRGMQVDESPQSDGTIDLTVQVDEGRPDGYYFYGGVGSFEGIIIGGGYYYRNLWNRLWNFSTKLEYTGLGILGEVRLIDPFFFRDEFSFEARLYGLTRGYDGYEKTEGGIGAEVDWFLTDRYSLTFRYNNSFTTVRSDGIPAAELGPTNYFLNTAGVLQKYDRRDDKVLPKKGLYAELATDLGFASKDDGIGFLRNEGRISYFYPLSERIHLAAGLRAGIIIPSEVGTDFPIDLRFFNGGASTVRSFPERELGPKASNGDPLGGEAYWAASLEYIQTIRGPLRGVLFVDAGALNERWDDFGGGDVKVAAGLGVRLDLPIGPVRLEYGFGVSGEEEDPSGAFHFAIGNAF